MATNLVLYGPFPVPYSVVAGTKSIAPADARAFWGQAALLPLATKNGCYVFALKASQGYLPWYVGITGKKKSKKRPKRAKAASSPIGRWGLKHETFTPDKLKKFNRAMSLRKTGAPVMFLVAPAGSIRKIPTAELLHMEKELIQNALARNPALINTQHTKNLPRWCIKGVIRGGKGRPNSGETAFRKLLGLA